LRSDYENRLKFLSLKNLRHFQTPWNFIYAAAKYRSYDVEFLNEIWLKKKKLRQQAKSQR